MTRRISIAEVAKNNTEQSAWVIVEGGVYDVTTFLDQHPGGKKILLRNTGKDASKAFAKFHNDRILKKYEKLKIGQVADDAKL
ncbi:hypothetical protein PYCC9005_001884 [Savitreella phatthalungensis]